MDEFEKKYGFKENKKTIAFHKSRRMFCIYKNQLFIAEPQLPYSHAVWFEKEGWTSKKSDAMDYLVRGIIDNKGNIYFYIGYNFEINDVAETVFFSHLKELVKKLNLKSNMEVFGGLIKQEAGRIWPPIKKYGKIESNL
jgi:hypothetical protein